MTWLVLHIYNQCLTDDSLFFQKSFLGMLVLCHKIPIARLFDRSMSRQSSTTSNVSKGSNEHYDDPFAVQHISFCPYGRVIAISCQSHFIAVFKFSNKENTIGTPVSN